ncbi:MAG TPA: glycosyl hydrolase, partial [Steroidobacteraceae bacterium]
MKRFLRIFSLLFFTAISSLLISADDTTPPAAPPDATATNAATAPAAADEPVSVPVGKGSYASAPLPNEKKAQALQTKHLYIDPSQDGKPIPTNHWWTYLIGNPTTGKSHGRMWPYPLAVETDASGLTVCHPTTWNNKGNDMEPGPGLLVTGDGFTPGDATALNWSDWTVGIRYKQDDSHLMDITVARGMPYTWFEYKGVTPMISLPKGATLEDAKGAPLTLPSTSNRLVVSVADRLFAVFAPDGSTFSGDATSLKVTGAAFLVVAALPSIDQIDLLTTYAYAVPRNTTYDWAYDPVKGEIETTWKIDTAALQGTNKDVIQGWLPHHYRTTRQDLKFNALEYSTPRGKLKCTTGQNFAIAWPFNGIPPLLPAPTETPSPDHPFSKDRMKAYLDGYLAERAGKTGKALYGSDTYWGGKSLTQYGLYGDIATELGFDDDAKTLLGNLRDALTDWYTYTPGETANYFARYDRWKGMVGFKSSYGSEGFVDNHFHYGYFTMATALLGMHDPQFLQDYGPMARLVAKQYANWDRTDTQFPLFRTFDPWAG